MQREEVARLKVARDEYFRTTGVTRALQGEVSDYKSVHWRAMANHLNSDDG
jgi:hypothetical protein